MVSLVVYMWLEVDLFYVLISRGTCVYPSIVEMLESSCLGFVSIYFQRKKTVGSALLRTVWCSPKCQQGL